MFIVGLTGGIGSGKTAASDIFKSLGINIVDADIVAREVVELGKPALEEIVKRFGGKILQADKTLDRAKLRARIFQHPEDKLWLEQLLHPIIREDSKYQLSNSAAAYSILVSPLLFETDQSKLVNRTLLIDVPVEVQLARVTKRDSNSLEQIQKIIDSQLPRNVKLSMADDIICNDTSLLELESKIKDKHAFYLEQAHEQNS
jgi:dephospho-CoA kinase